MGFEVWHCHTTPWLVAMPCHLGQAVRVGKGWLCVYEDGTAVSLSVCVFCVYVCTLYVHGKQLCSRIFCCISFYGIPTNWAQLCNIRQTNTCMSLVKNPSSHVFSHACFSRTSSLLCLLQLNVPFQICLSLSPMSTSGKHCFMYLPQRNTIQHIDFPLQTTHNHL